MSTTDNAPPVTRDSGGSAKGKPAGQSHADGGRKEPTVARAAARGAQAEAASAGGSGAADKGARKSEGASKLAQGARRYLDDSGAKTAGGSGNGADAKAAAAAKPKPTEKAASSAPESAKPESAKKAETSGKGAAIASIRPESAAAGSGAGAASAEAGAAAVAVESDLALAPGGSGPSVPAVAEPSDLGPVEDPFASCLSFLSKIYGHAYDEAQLRAGVVLENGRLNLDGMLEAATRIGFEATTENTNLKSIPRLALPAIALLKDNRACVILRFGKRGKVEVFDPRAGQGTTMVKLSELDSLYDGMVVYVRPQFRFDNRSEIASIDTPGSWFWGSLLQNWWIYGHAVLATVIVNILAIASPIFIMTVYDRVVPNNAVETLWVLAFGILGVAAFDFCLRTLRAYLVDVAGKRIDIHLGSKLFDHVVRLRMDSRNSSAGSLASIMREFDFLREFLSSATVTAIGDLPFIFLFIFVIYLIGGPIAYVPMAVVPFVLLVSILIQIPLHRVTQNSMKEVTQKNAHLFEVLHGIETIKAIRAENWAQRNWEQLVGLTATSSMKMKMLSQIGTHTTMTAQLLTTVGIVVVGVHVLREGDITQGAMIACVLLSSRVMAPLAQVAGVLVRYEQTKSAFTALQEIMKAPVERAPGKKLVHKPFLTGDVEFKEVSFAYPMMETAALNKISFKVKAGEHVAIIGRVGSGKSTVLKLVQNLYEPAEGFVRVDDLDTRQIELADLRRQVGYTPQETMLFHGTIRDNLVQGAPHATDEQVLTAANLAGLDDMIKGSPKGLDQEVGEHGTLLSGGQRQMIVLARALVLDPPILLMDEPTSHMDNFGERQFISKMKEWLEGRTMILVTHRATLLALVDRLIVMDKGQIVADGPKEEVLNALAAGKIGAAQT